jgi:hypothetical protein
MLPAMPRAEAAQDPAIHDATSLVLARDQYEGASLKPFQQDVREILRRKIDPENVEITPDGRVYLSGIHFRRTLDEAFGPGGWAMIPRSGFVMRDNVMSREYALYVGGRFVSESRGEQDYQPGNLTTSEATATEGVKSNAIMRCCKDLLVGSELWDRKWTRWWKKEYAEQWWCEHQTKKERKPLWRRKDDEFEYPWVQGQRVEKKGAAPAPAAPAAPVQATVPAAPKAVAPPKAPPKALPPATPAPTPAAADSALRQRLWPILKKAAETTDEGKAREFLKLWTGKAKVSELDIDELKKFGNALVGLNKGTHEPARGEGGFLQIVDKAHGTIAYQSPAPAEEAPMQEPAEGGQEEVPMF